MIVFFNQKTRIGPLRTESLNSTGSGKERLKLKGNRVFVGLLEKLEAHQPSCTQHSRGVKSSFRDLNQVFFPKGRTISKSNPDGPKDFLSTQSLFHLFVFECYRSGKRGLVVSRERLAVVGSEIRQGRGKRQLTLLVNDVLVVVVSIYIYLKLSFSVYWVTLGDCKVTLWGLKVWYLNHKVIFRVES